MTAKTSSLRLANLPAVRIYRATAIADQPQLLPPLAGTALHGALSDTLAERGSNLLTAPDRRLPGLGITGRPPAPLVLAPARFSPDGRPIELASGEPIAFRIATIGERAAGQGDELAQAVQAAFARGLGMHPGARSSRPRPSLRLARWDEVMVEAARPRELAPKSCRMTLLTPLRLQTEGRITSFPDGAALRDAVVRRADTLAQIYGGGALFRSPPAALPALELEDALLRVTNVGRYSRRQGRRMRWPGLVGELILGGPGLTLLWPLLRFCEQVQLGKATAFGFGSFRLEPLVTTRSFGA